MFSRLVISQCQADEYTVYFGESREEALSADKNTYLWEKARKDTVLSSRAFRYVFINTEKTMNVYAEYEYIPFEYKGAFKCEDELINKIWDISAYTFHLNAREFFLDGIKRDRWVWSGDAYQSFKINEYLFLDYPSVRRTITALRGKDPINTHINTINDYSLYLIIGTYEYYFSSADTDFIKFIYPRIKTLCDFIISRLDENGFVVQRDGDWIFIDWSDIDKDGAPCAEQMLLYRAMICMAELSEAVGVCGAQYKERADDLLGKINRYFWCEEKGAYIDSFTSGICHVTRHANIFALLYDIASDEQKEKIIFIAFGAFVSLMTLHISEARNNSEAIIVDSPPPYTEVVEITTEKEYITIDIPMDAEVQEWIYTYCTDRDISPAIVIAIIEKESKK